MSQSGQSHFRIEMQAKLERCYLCLFVFVYHCLPPLIWCSLHHNIKRKTTRLRINVIIFFEKHSYLQCTKIKHADWLFQIPWLFLTNQSPLFQHSIATLLVCAIGTNFRPTLAHKWMIWIDVKGKKLLGLKLGLTQWKPAWTKSTTVFGVLKWTNIFSYF